MRPVNLIPRGERRGEKAPLRTGPLGYVIIGLLLLALGGVTLVVMTGNKISDRKAEVASLQSQVNAAQAQADQLSTYTNFAALQQARQETVTSLATSRFDWERTLRELAIVLPGDVWLTSIKASAAADSSSSGSATSGLSVAAAGVTGPSLDIEGCASGHEAVAKFLAALRDIDGLTRVTVMSSDRPGAGSSTSSSSSSSSGTTTLGCASRNFIATFDVVAAFDGAQSVASTPPSSSSTSSTSTTTAAADQGTSGTQPPAGSSGGSSPNNGASPSAVVSGTGGTP
jgi:Tfp pilus assembly protein PilN